MMEQIKKYIRGNKERGYDVIAELEKLGGKNILKLKGDEYDKVYYIERYKYTNANTIDFVSQKSFIGQLIVTHPDWEEIELPKYKYPTTYEECCKVLMGKTDFQDYELVLTKLTINQSEENSISPEPPYISLINVFYKLLICRDAYWKIAGEEMGLGKSWEPDWKDRNQKKYCIYNGEGRIVKHVWYFTNSILAFPTEEMRDAFKENFEEEIELVKELL